MDSDGGVFGAGRGNRTLIASLEGWCFTTKLYPLNAMPHPGNRVNGAAIAI
jgi:hypothetical protein